MKNKLIPEFVNTFKVRRRDWYINFKWAFLNTENTNYICALTRKTTAEAVVHSPRWGAIRESDPFMSGSQPDVLTVSPIAPRLKYDRCVADYSQGKNSQSANSNF